MLSQTTESLMLLQ